MLRAQSDLLTFEIDDGIVVVVEALSPHPRVGTLERRPE